MSDLIYYAIYDKKLNGDINHCIDDGYDREELIESVSRHFEREYEENSEYGEGEKDLILVTIDERGEETIETLEDITIKWIAERDTYDGGRFDFYTSRL